jgi:5-methylcytosine-specific restriction endonuclease McrA
MPLETANCCVKQSKKEYNKLYYAAHREESKARTAKWHRDNPERSKEQGRKFQRNNPGYQKARYRKNPADKRAATKKSREKDIEGSRAKDRSAYWANVEKERAQAREWAREHYKPRTRRRSPYASRSEYYQHWKRLNPDRRTKAERERKDAKRSNGGTHSVQEWRALLALCGPACLCCGRIRKLQLDHILPVKKGGTGWIWNIQPLCGECNSRKHAKWIDYRPKEVRLIFRDLLI